MKGRTINLHRQRPSHVIAGLVWKTALINDRQQAFSCIVRNKLLSSLSWKVEYGFHALLVNGTLGLYYTDPEKIFKKEKDMLEGHGSSIGRMTLMAFPSSSH